MEILLIVIIVLAAAPYVLGPVLVYRRQRQNPRPSCSARPVPPGRACPQASRCPQTSRVPCGRWSASQRFNAFCPDIVTQGTGTVAALARELKRSRELYCWWD